VRGQADHDRPDAVFFSGQTLDFGGGDARGVAFETGRTQHAEWPRERPRGVTDGDADSPLADVETDDTHAIILSSFPPMTVRCFSCIVALALSASLAAQAPEGGRADAEARRVNDRIRTLQVEADRLAGQARTLLGDLRTLEVERALQDERVREAQAAIARGRAAIEASGTHIAALEQQRVSQLPDLQTQLVDIYKRGRAGYAKLLFGATGVREFGRATRAVAALIAINQRRVAEHQRTLDALNQERAKLEAELQALQAREAEAVAARTSANRAVASRAALIAQIDARRDLNAQLAGELQLAQERLQQQVASLAAGGAVEPVAIPILPFRGSLEWPVAGRVTRRFGQRDGRFEDAATSNGIEIAAPEGTPVRALHSGTVSFADVFTGFGNLVIVDHGANVYSLYGYLSSISAAQGAAVDAGSEVGAVGTAPAGPAALYLEIRVDGRSVDPVQWLKPR
jgi:septal ring factor EnvC (AmiA/AmiB activator)